MRVKLKVIIVVLSVTLLFLLTIYFYNNYYRFSQANWKSDIERSAMVSSIINSGSLDKKSYHEVIGFLGEPSFYRGTKTQTKDTTTLTLVYLTGGSQFIDLQLLCLNIVDDSVTKVYVDYD